MKEPMQISMVAIPFENTQITSNNHELLQVLFTQIERYKHHGGSYYFGDISANLFPKIGEKEETLVAKLMNEIQSSYILLGDGGIGKTVFLMETCIHLLENNVPAYYLPLHELHGKRIADYIFEYKDTLKHFFWESEYCVLLLDGFNEVEDAHKDAVFSEIEMLSKKINVQIVMTSRADPRKYDFPFNGFEYIELQPLKEIEICTYLNEKGVDIPKNIEVMAILRYPLMLTLYSEATEYERLYGRHHALSWQLNVNSGSEIVWNYLQIQLQKIVFESNNRPELLRYVFVLEYVLPNIAYKMVEQELYEIDQRDLLKILSNYIKECEESWSENLPERLEDITLDYDCEDIEYNHKKIWKILKKLNVMSINTNNNFCFFHQYFRDCLAAMHLVKRIENSLKVPAEFKSRISENILISISELINKNLFDILFNRLRKHELSADDYTLYNLMDIYAQWHGKDACSLDFSQIDLRRFSLREYLLSNKNSCAKFDGALVSLDTFFQQGHCDSISCIVISNDEKFFMTGSKDTSIRVWDTLSATSILSLDGCTGMVTSLFVPNNTDGEVYSSSIDGSIRKWDYYSGSGTIIYMHDCAISKVVVYQNSIYFVDANCNVYRLTDNNTEKEFISYGNDICISINSCLLGIVNTSGEIYIINLMNQVTKKVYIASQNISCISFNNDGDKLFYGTENGQVYCLDFCTNKHVFVGEHSNRINTINIYDEKRILTASDDKVICLWDFEKLTEECRFLGHYREVCGITSLCRKELIISGSVDNSIKIWNRNGRLIKTIEGYTNWINGISKAIHNDLVVTVSGDMSVRIWKYPEFDYLFSLTGHTEWVYCCDITEDGKFAVTGGADGILIVWDLEKRIKMGCVNICNGIIYEVDIAEDGKTCIVADSTGKVSVIDLLNISIKRIEKVDDSAIYGVKFLNATIAICVTGTGKIVQLDIADFTQKNISKAHNSVIHSIDVSKDAAFMITGGNDGYVKLWDLKSFESKNIICDYGSMIRCVAISPNGEYGACGTMNGDVVVWSFYNLSDLKNIGKHQGEVRTIRFLNNTDLISGGTDSTVWVHSLADNFNPYSISPFPILNISNCSFINTSFPDEYTKKVIVYNNGRID